MEHNPSQQAASQIKRGPVHEGPRNHLLTFALSIVLTFLAFVAVANPNLSDVFKNSLLVLMAIVQVLFQLFFWMHLKDRGHTFPIIFMGFGVLVMITLVVMAVFWVWW
jgi:cytochrome c oxidase subunit 4